LVCGNGFGYGSSCAQAKDALNVARCMKNTDQPMSSIAQSQAAEVMHSPPMFGEESQAVRAIAVASIPSPQQTPRTSRSGKLRSSHAATGKSLRNKTPRQKYTQGPDSCHRKRGRYFVLGPPEAIHEQYVEHGERARRSRHGLIARRSQECAGYPATGARATGMSNSTTAVSAWKSTRKSDAGP